MTRCIELMELYEGNNCTHEINIDEQNERK